MRYKKIIFTASLALVFALSLVLPAFAKTECKSEDCGIAITVKIAFTGAGATDARVQAWTEEINDVWNNDWEFGPCDCPVEFKVETKKVDSCPSAGFHCVAVETGLARDSNGRAHVAFMDKVAGAGESVGGTWSGPKTSRPIPSGGFTLGGETYTPTEGETFKDAAHEAGHAMGLDDEYDAAAGNYPTNLMGRTWGADAKPLQRHIDAIVNHNCTGEKCPNNCCCGNGEIDADISPAEQCDYEADPNGCSEGETCSDQCMCEADDEADECGDGKITGDEECDTAASPTGCSEGETCSDECMCEEDDDEAECGNGECEEGEDKSNCCDDCGCDGSLVCVDNECQSPACSTNADCDDSKFCTEDKCVNPGTAEARCENTAITECVGGDLCCPAGCYNTRANGDSDCISECGNSVCELAESCYNCGADCACSSGESCDPNHSAADDRGCYPTAECGDGACTTGEDCANCSADCSCPSGLVCSPDDPEATPSGCILASGPVCGDGTCAMPDESCVTCPSDCVCPTGASCDPGPAADDMGCIMTGPFCGDASCDYQSGENCSNCAPDCGCVPPAECAPGIPGANNFGCLE